MTSVQVSLDSLGIGELGPTSLHPIDDLIFTLGLVVLGHNGRDAIQVSEWTSNTGVGETAYEQQALLTPDMAADEQWIGRKLVRGRCLSDDRRGLRRGAAEADAEARSCL